LKFEPFFLFYCSFVSNYHQFISMDYPQPPPDIEMKNIIDKLAQFVARNGSEFENMTKHKQQGNPMFSFLFPGGYHHDYYCYRVMTEQNMMGLHEQQQRGPMPGMPPHQQHPRQSMPGMPPFNNPHIQYQRPPMMPGPMSGVPNLNPNLAPHFNNQFPPHSQVPPGPPHYNHRPPQQGQPPFAPVSMHQTPFPIPGPPQMSMQPNLFGDARGVNNQPPPAPVPVSLPVPPPTNIPYFELPAGLMVPLVNLSDFDYKSIDPKDIRLPPPTPPSEKLLKAVEAFYGPPSHERPRNSEGWEQLGLYEFYKEKSAHRKDDHNSSDSDSGGDSKDRSSRSSHNDRKKSPTHINRRNDRR
jgi:calcium homeostasis ER protein